MCNEVFCHKADWNQTRNYFPVAAHLYTEILPGWKSLLSPVSTKSWSGLYPVLSWQCYKMVLSLIILILLSAQARCATIPYPRYSPDQSAVHFGIHEAAAAQAVVVEAGHDGDDSHRNPKHFGVIFGSFQPGQSEGNTDCKGYSMLGCVWGIVCCSYIIKSYYWEHEDFAKCLMLPSLAPAQLEG